MERDREERREQAEGKGQRGETEKIHTTDRGEQKRRDGGKETEGNRCKERAEGNRPRERDRGGSRGKETEGKK